MKMAHMTTRLIMLGPDLRTDIRSAKNIYMYKDFKNKKIINCVKSHFSRDMIFWPNSKISVKIDRNLKRKF